MFSVVIPTYNREKDLGNCLDSIVDQTILPLEVIIVDDGALEIDFLDEWRSKFETKDIDFVYHRKITKSSHADHLRHATKR